MKIKDYYTALNTDIVFVLLTNIKNTNDCWQFNI